MPTRSGLLESSLQGFANPYWLAMQSAAAVSPPAPAAAAANTSALNSLALMQQLAAINPQYVMVGHGVSVQFNVRVAAIATSTSTTTATTASSSRGGDGIITATTTIDGDSTTIARQHSRTAI